MSKSNNQENILSVCHIDLQLSEKCNVLTLCGEAIGLIEKLNSAGLQVTGLRIDVEHAQQHIQMECSNLQEPSTVFDKY